MKPFSHKDAPWRSACRGLFIAAVAGFWGAGCTAETTSVAPVGAPTGSVEFAVGARVRQFDLLDASCERVTRAGRTHLHIVAPAAFETSANGQTNQPNILVAQLPVELLSAPRRGDEKPNEITFGRASARYGATASALQVDYDGEDYNMIQLIAQSARDAADYECRAHRVGEQIELVCNDALVFPWRNPGAVPSGSFRARFRCALAPEN